jgi:hypothetical protein
VLVTLTDGVVSVEGVEVSPFAPPAPGALPDEGALHPHTPPGTKVGLLGVPLRRGRLLLTPDNCTVLGECGMKRGRGCSGRGWPTREFVYLCARAVHAPQSLPLCSPDSSHARRRHRAATS